MTLATALRQGAQLLEEAAVAVPRLTAEVLLAHALRDNSGKTRDRVWLIAHSDEELSELAWIHYGRYLHQRLQGKPTQHITKKQEFYGRDFRVSPAVLIPRPETEHSVETALRRSPGAKRVVDIGTGSGAIGITLALELGIPVALTDISFDALRVAAYNAKHLGANATFVCCDLGAALTGQWDAVVSNPPYIPYSEAEGLAPEVRDHEPHVALFGGELGTEPYLQLIADAERLLRPGGLLVMELGYRGLDSVRAMLGPQWSDIEVTHDLAGWPRVLSAVR
jgi:release factor glutamine methyltransferase